MNSTIGKYISMQKVANILDCTERHIYNLIIDGELIAIKIGGRAVRISENLLIEFIERKKINPDDLFDPDIENNNRKTFPNQTQKK